MFNVFMKMYGTDKSNDPKNDIQHEQVCYYRHTVFAVVVRQRL